MTNHRYTVTNMDQVKESVTVYWRLGLAASFIASVLTYGIHRLHAFAPELGLASIPISTALIYIVLAEWTSSHLWRWYWSRTLLGITTPKLSGDWVATVEKTQGKKKSADLGEFVIEQKWRTMSIALTTANATSRSTSSALIVGGGHVRLEYQYHAGRINRPGNKFVPHQGAAFMDFPTDGCDKATNLTLSYFTEHGETGIITLIRKVKPNHLVNRTS